jgi:hypothetical protein
MTIDAIKCNSQPCIDEREKFSARFRRGLTSRFLSDGRKILTRTNKDSSVTGAISSAMGAKSSMA